MSLTLTYKADTQVPVEVEGILPEMLDGKSRAQIEQLRIDHGDLVSWGRSEILLPAA